MESVFISATHAIGDQNAPDGGVEPPGDVAGCEQRCDEILFGAELRDDEALGAGEDSGDSHEGPPAAALVDVLRQ